jgi:hypothetical protein
MDSPSTRSVIATESDEEAEKRATTSAKSLNDAPSATKPLAIKTNDDSSGNEAESVSDCDVDRRACDSSESEAISGIDSDDDVSEKYLLDGVPPRDSLVIAEDDITGIVHLLDDNECVAR